METSSTLEAIVRENMRLRKIEAAAKTFAENFDCADGSAHESDCGIIPHLRYDGAAIDSDCTCGLIALQNALEGK